MTTEIVRWYPKTYEDLEWYTDFKLAQEDPTVLLPDVNDVRVAITRSWVREVTWIEVKWYLTLEQALAAAPNYMTPNSYVRVDTPWESFVLVRTK